MSRTVLELIHAINFKGIKDKCITFDHVLTELSGINGSCKTSFYDAYLWCLFGINSLGLTDKGTNNFSRPKDADGKTDDSIETSVLCQFDIDGKKLSLMRVQKENKSRVRGTDQYISKGRKNEYYVNDVLKNENDFVQTIKDEIVNPEIFKLLTNTDYFMDLPNEDQKGKKGKMSLLLELAGDITDESIINENPDKWSPVAEDILELGTKEATAKAKKDKNYLSKQGADIDPRIDEISRQIREVPDTDALKEKAESLQIQINEWNRRHDKLKADSSMPLLEKRKAEVEMELNSILSKEKTKLAEQKEALMNICISKKAASNAAVLAVQKIRLEVSSIENRIQMLNEELNRYGAIYKEAIGRTFDNTATMCKSCGQILPKGKVEQITKDFEIRKKKDSDDALAKGRELRAKINLQKQLLEQKQKEQNDSEDKAAVAIEEMERSEEALKSFQTEVDLSGNQIVEGLHLELSNIKESIEKASVVNKQITELAFEATNLAEEYESVKKQIADAEAIANVNASINKRIEDLREEKRNIGAAIAMAEMKIVLLEEFSIVRSQKLSEKINSCFKIARFSLIDEYQSGGVTSTVRVVLDGIDGLNINHGNLLMTKIDIINTFQKHYDCFLPLFVDNAECLSSDNQPQTECQMILLKVTDDPKLVVSP